jgi:hypothetical protein
MKSGECCCWASQNHGFRDSLSCVVWVLGEAGLPRHCRRQWWRQSHCAWCDHVWSVSGVVGALAAMPLVRGQVCVWGCVLCMAYPSHAKGKEESQHNCIRLVLSKAFSSCHFLCVCAPSLCRSPLSIALSGLRQRQAGQVWAQSESCVTEWGLGSSGE